MLFIRWFWVRARAFSHRSISKIFRLFGIFSLKFVVGVCLMFFSLKATAQQTDTVSKVTKITGRVIDAVTGEPVPYVTVKISGSSYAVSTDSAGEFNLSRSIAFAKVT